MTFLAVLYERCFLVFSRETALLCHGGSRMMTSKRDVLRVYDVNVEEAEGNVSRIKEDREGI